LEPGHGVAKQFIHRKEKKRTGTNKGEKKTKGGKTKNRGEMERICLSRKQRKKSSGRRREQRKKKNEGGEKKKRPHGDVLTVHERIARRNEERGRGEKKKKKQMGVFDGSGHKNRTGTPGGKGEKLGVWTPGVQPLGGGGPKGKRGKKQGGGKDADKADSH